MVHRSNFNPKKDIPSLAGKVILITGGNIGIGKQTALDLSAHNPAQIWIAARNATKSAAAIAELKANAPGVVVKFLEMDLGSFESVKGAARAFSAEVGRLDILILNAGIMGGAAGTTKEGYELRLGTNHMGHALLLKLLTPLLLKASSLTSPSEVRVVSISSAGHKYVAAGAMNFSTLKSAEENISTLDRYSQSKLATALYVQEVAKRNPGFTILSIDPGTVKTDLFTPNGGGVMVGFLQRIVVPFVGTSVPEGAKNHLWGATAKGVVSGEYYEPVGVAGKASKLLGDKELGRKMWEFTEKELQGHEL